jgi:spore coat protein U-like protein
MKIRFSAISAAGAFAAAASLSPLTAHAGNANIDVNVTATVVATCTITKTSDVAFSTTIDPTATATLLAQGEVRLTCNKGAAPQVTIDNGKNISAGVRRMIKGGTDFLSYSLKQPTGFTSCPAAGVGTDWIGTTALSASSAFSTNGGPQLIAICGQLTTPQLDAGPGAYTDTVNVLATF